MEEAQLYAKFKHTVSCQIEYAAGDDAVEWYDLDVYSNSDDPKTALEGYLSAEFEAEASNKGGVYTVVDTSGPFEVTRRYQLK